MGLPRPWRRACRWLALRPRSCPSTPAGSLCLGTLHGPSRLARALTSLRVATDPAPHRSRSCAAGPVGTWAAARPRALGCPLSHISYQAPRTTGPPTGCVSLPTSLTRLGPSVALWLIAQRPARSPLAFPPETLYFCLGLSPTFATSSPPLPNPSLPRVLGYLGSLGSPLPPCDPLYSVSRVSSLNPSVPAVLRLCLGVAPLMLSSPRRAALPVPCLEPGPGPPGLPHCCLRWQARAHSSVRGSLRALHYAHTRAAGSLLTQCFRPRTSASLLPPPSVALQPFCALWLLPVLAPRGACCLSSHSGLLRPLVALPVSALLPLVLAHLLLASRRAASHCGALSVLPAGSLAWHVQFLSSVSCFVCVVSGHWRIVFVAAGQPKRFRRRAHFCGALGPVGLGPPDVSSELPSGCVYSHLCWLVAVHSLHGPRSAVSCEAPKGALYRNGAPRPQVSPARSLAVLSPHLTLLPSCSPSFTPRLRTSAAPAWAAPAVAGSTSGARGAGALPPRGSTADAAPLGAEGADGASQGLPTTYPLRAAAATPSAPWALRQATAGAMPCRPLLGLQSLRSSRACGLGSGSRHDSCCASSSGVRRCAFCSSLCSFRGRGLGSFSGSCRGSSLACLACPCSSCLATWSASVCPCPGSWRGGPRPYHGTSCSWGCGSCRLADCAPDPADSVRTPTACRTS